jgi:hypothetical protein
MWQRTVSDRTFIATTTNNIIIILLQIFYFGSFALHYCPSLEDIDLPAVLSHSFERIWKVRGAKLSAGHCTCGDILQNEEGAPGEGIL